VKLAVNFRPAARADFDEIGRYTMQNWGLTKTRNYLLEITEAVDRLAEHKGIGADYSFVMTGLRKLAVGSHKVIYETDDTTIHVVRILHERMDIGTLT